MMQSGCVLFNYKVFHSCETLFYEKIVFLFTGPAKYSEVA